MPEFFGETVITLISLYYYVLMFSASALSHSSNYLKYEECKPLVSLNKSLPRQCFVKDFALY